MAQAHVIPEAIARTVPQPAYTIGIVGSGPVGHAIAQAALRRGFHVRLVDSTPEAAAKARAAIGTALDWLAARGRLDGVDPVAMLGRLGASAHLGDLGGAALVIEASSDDDVEAKLQSLRELDAALAPDTILATHTAGVSVTKLAAATKHPERVVGLHMMEPVAVSDLVEVVRALQTSDAAHEEACRLVRSLGKTLVQAKDHPGFLAHRLLVPLINEACFALQEGLGTVEDIDAALRVGDGSMGPLRMADELGLDKCLFMAERFQRELGDGKYRPAQILRNYVAAGWFGRKARRGFYTYP